MYIYIYIYICVYMYSLEDSIPNDGIRLQQYSMLELDTSATRYRTTDTGRRCTTWSASRGSHAHTPAQKEVLQTSNCAHLLFEDVLQTVLGMGVRGYEWHSSV